MARASLQGSLPQILKMVIHSMGPILEFGPWVWPRGASGALPQSLLQLDTFLPTPQAFLDGV